MTAEELGNLADESLRHELIKGELLTMPVPKLLHGFVTVKLSVLLYNHIEANKHVESFGVGFWIRVQFSAPPP